MPSKWRRKTSLMSPSIFSSPSSSLSDPLSSLPKNPWSNLQKETLLILVEEYQANWKTVKQVFNDIYQQEIPSPMGLTEKALRTYYWGIKRGRSRINGQRSILRAFAIDLIQERLSNRNLSCDVGDIYTEASDDDAFMFKAVDPRLQAQESFTLLYKELINYTQTTSKIQSGLPSIVQDQNIMISPSETHIAALSPTSSPNRSSKSVKAFRPLNANDYPLLGFRAFSDKSQGLNAREGFLAGRFHGGDNLPQPHPQSEENRHLVIGHVERNNQILSPFISLTENPYAAVHRALRMGSKSSIAVVDLHRAGRIGIYEQQGRLPLIQSVADLNIYAETGYRGTCEFLIWKEIQRESVLSVVPLKRILSLPPQMPNDWDPFGIHTVKAAQSAGIARRETSSKPMSLSFDSGRAVAQFLLLLRIPLSFLENAVSVILHDWRFDGRDQDWRTHQEFMRGLKSITDVWQALANNAYENSLEALQTALHGRRSSENEEDRDIFQYKAEADEVIDQDLNDLMGWIIDAPMQEGTPEEESVEEFNEEETFIGKEKDGEKEEVDFARAPVAPAEVLVWQPGPWASGWGRWTEPSNDDFL